MGKSILVPAEAGWTARGAFAPKGDQYYTHFESEIPERERRDYAFWASAPGRDSNTGQLLSPLFRAPTFLECLVSGYPDLPESGLFLQIEGTGERIPLVIRWDRKPAEYWRRIIWRLPSSLNGRRVRLLAIDGNTAEPGWVGVTAPRGLNTVQLLHQQLPPTLLTLLVFLFDFALFLSPGFAIGTALFRRIEPPPLIAVIAIVTASATLGVLSFWAFFLGKTLGRCLCFGIYLGCLAQLVVAARKGQCLRLLVKGTREPFLYAAAAGVLYTCLLFLYTNPFTANADLPDGRFFEQSRPGDNLIPLIFADRLYDRKPLRPFCCGGWLSSDRPPLQTGIFLLQRRIRMFAGTGLHYQLLSTGLQCLWICGVWCLLTALRASPLRIRQTLGFLIFSGFLFFNSVYTWPKLLACACLLFLLAMVLNLIGQRRTATTFEVCLASISLGLTVLGHPGSVFSLPAFGAVGFRYRRLITLRQVGLAALIVSAFILPWSAYQRFVDPPGDRLLKMHLGGEIDPTTRSTWQVVRDAYARYSAADILRFKASNLALLFGRKPFDFFGLDSLSIKPHPQIDPAKTERSRIAQREYIWNALGLLNVGWLALLVLRLRAIGKPAIQCAGWLVLAAAFNLVIWSLVIFGPDATVTTHSSYADIFLLSVGLLGWILTLPRLAVLCLFALELFNLLVVWILSFPRSEAPPGALIAPVMQLPMLVFGILGLSFLAIHFGKSYRTEHNEIAG